LFAGHSHEINLIINKGIKISRDATYEFFVLFNLSGSGCTIFFEKISTPELMTSEFSLKLAV